MILKIKLLSDMCTGSGEIYNSLADIDVVYDECGLPYIPAKRIKGCIREAYLELVDMGIYSNGMYEYIFGAEGDKSSAFAIDNAYIKNYEDTRVDIQSCEDKDLVHQQNVLALYTYMRSQTSVDYSTCTAKKGSLRNTRVVKRGMEFYADVEWVSGASDDIRQSFVNAAQMVTHMGIRRTRGLGLVSITVCDNNTKNAGMVSSKNTKDKLSSLTKQIKPGTNRISYSLYLKSPVRCKSPEGNETSTSRYIEGSRIIGIIAGILGQERFAELMGMNENGHEMICSNAYIAYQNQRCIPLRASLQKSKDQSYNGKGELEVYDMLSADNVNEQITPVGAEYMSENGTVMDVDTTISYHHKRPEDKSTGRANGNDESSFYQIESINRDQTFCGHIIAGEKQTRLILEALINNSSVRIGNGRNAEFGQVHLNVEGCEPVVKPEKELSKDFIIELVSPVILYNDNGMPSADVDTLVRYIAEETGEEAEDMEISSCFLKYETVGGFNVTWGMKKPVFQTIGKGSVCRIHSKNEVDISELNGAFIGERVSEGYGELRVLDDESPRVTLYKPAKTCKPKRTEKTDIVGRLRRNRAISILAEYARNMAEEKRNKFNKKEDNAIIDRLILVNREQKTYENMEKQVDDWCSDSKKERAGDIIKNIEKLKNCESMSEDIKKEICDLLSEEERYKIASREYLMRLKYNYRAGKGGQD